MEDRIMFELYRDPFGVVRVIYYTELDEESRSREIDRAMHGESIIDGYLAISKARDGKAEIARVLEEMASGAPVSPQAIASRLKPYLVD